MTLKEMKRKILSLIEEIDEEEEGLTGDPDIGAKLVPVMNQVMYELARVRKLPDYVELPVEAGDTVTFEDIADRSGYAVYQLDMVRGAGHEVKAQGTILRALEAGTLEIEYFRYPERITEKTRDGFRLELPEDVLEVMPYGVAADLLKSDVSSEYGAVYASRYEALLQRLDSRYAAGAITVEGGFDI